MPRELRLLGLDPGLASFGLAVAHVTDEQVRFVHVAVLTTEPMRGERKTDSTASRCHYLATQLAWWLADQVPHVVCCEAIALPFGKVQTSVVSALGRVRGVVDALAAVRGIPVLESGPQALKRATVGTPSAAKADVKAALEGIYPELAALWPRLRTQHEHAADACASILAARDRWPAC